MSHPEWSDIALCLAGAVAVCALATCQIKRELNWKEIELEKLKLSQGEQK